MRAHHVEAREIVPLVGTATPKHLEYAANFRSTLPESITAALHNPQSAAAVVFGLLFSRDSKTQQQQRSSITERFRKRE
jgi:hypothetical protein